MKFREILLDLPFVSEAVDFFKKRKLPTRKRFYNWIRKNGLVAVLALFAATVIYIALQEKITQKTFTVKVSVYGVDESPSRSRHGIASNGAGNSSEEPVKVFAVKPNVVDVTLSGSFSDLQLFEPSKLEVAIPKNALKDSGEENYYIKIKDRFVKGTSHLNVFKIRPNKVRVTSDTRTSQTFQIATPEIKMIQSFQGRAEIIQVRPNRVLLSGWSSKLESLASSGAQLELEPIEVDGRVRSFTREVEFRPVYDNDGSLMTMSPNRVMVTVEIMPDTIERTFTNLTVNVAVPAGSSYPLGYKISQKKVSVSLFGQEKSLSAFNNMDVAAYVDIPTYTNRPGKTQLPIRIWVRPNAEIVSAKADPTTITLFPPPRIPVTNSLPIPRSKNINREASKNFVTSAVPGKAMSGKIKGHAAATGHSSVGGKPKAIPAITGRPSDSSRKTTTNTVVKIRK